MKYILWILFFLTIHVAKAQSLLTRPTHLNYEMDASIKDKILTRLDTLFIQIKNNTLDKLLVGKGETDFNTLKSFFEIEANKKDSIIDFYKKQLINFYPISDNDYWLSIAYIGQKNNEIPVLKAIVNLIASNIEGKVIFSTPTKYLTKTWKSKNIGNIAYFFRGTLNVDRATKFDERNTNIAKKLGLEPEKFDFYMCYNYQEVLKLLGYEYDMESNGKTKEGYGVDGNTIFSVMNNEDFSHDVFHYYSGKFRKQVGNRTVEEGIAYSWGNAYYTDANGEMIEQKKLIQNLRTYLQKNSKTSLLELFLKDPKIFNHLSTEISIKSTLSSLICDEVERKRGIESIKSLIKCGRGDDNFFKAVNDLIALNKTNFDTEIGRLIAKYQE
jgi:hypothetical protein